MKYKLKYMKLTKKTLRENKLNFVKDVPMILVNFIVILSVLSEEKKVGGITFVLTFVLAFLPLILELGGRLASFSVHLTHGERIPTSMCWIVCIRVSLDMLVKSRTLSFPGTWNL
jgi:hypothetical protein